MPRQDHDSIAAEFTPPWTGFVQTTGDALLLLEAARRGIIPRVTRRLVDGERRMINSGAVFVFDEDESGIKRWTDGYFWSPSRILGNFLIYRETERKGAGPGRANAKRKSKGIGRDDSGVSDGDDLDPLGNIARKSTSLSRPRDIADLSLRPDKQRERTLLGSLTNSAKFKPDGLLKKVRITPLSTVACLMLPRHSH